jgi:hypothetical protein
MAGVWDRPLKVGKVGHYAIYEDPKWLGESSIVSATATADPADVRVVNTVANDDHIIVFLEGIAPGFHKVRIDYTIGTGSTERCIGTVKVVA